MVPTQSVGMGRMLPVPIVLPTKMMATMVQEWTADWAATGPVTLRFLVPTAVRAVSIHPVGEPVVMAILVATETMARADLERPVQGPVLPAVGCQKMDQTGTQVTQVRVVAAVALVAA